MGLKFKSYRILITPEECEKENDNFTPERKENTGVQKWPFLFVMQNGSGLV